MFYIISDPVLTEGPSFRSFLTLLAILYSNRNVGLNHFAQETKCTHKSSLCPLNSPILKAIPFFSVVSAIYDITASNRVVRNPEKPLIAEPTNITYKGNSKYMIVSMTMLSNKAPITGVMRAGFLRPDLSVQGPQNGATISDGMAMKNEFPKSILAARLCT